MNIEITLLITEIEILIILILTENNILIGNLKYLLYSF